MNTLFKHLTKNAKERDRSVVVWVMRPGRFRNGTMKESFQALGTLPTQMNKLNSWAIEGAILEAVDLNILDEMPSGPFDFEVSSPQSISYTWSL